MRGNTRKKRKPPAWGDLRAKLEPRNTGWFRADFRHFRWVEKQAGESNGVVNAPLRFTSDGNADRRTAWLRRFPEVCTVAVISGLQVHLFRALASKTGLMKWEKPETKAFWAVKYGAVLWCNTGKGKNMDSENKQRISLYLDKETVAKMDETIRQYGYRSRNDFVSSAVDNLIADKLLGENDTVISDKLSKAIAKMSEAQTLQIAKSMFRYAVEMELIMRMFSEITDFTPSEIEEMRKEAIRNVRRTRGEVRLDDLFKRKDTQSL